MDIQQAVDKLMQKPSTLTAKRRKTRDQTVKGLMCHLLEAKTNHTQAPMP